MIEVSNIVKRYGTLEVLRDVSLRVNDGEIMSITGPSGAGKSTLLQIMGTLLSADSGRVVYDGTELSRLSDNALSRFRNANIGFVFQFHRLLPEFTLEENVAMPALIGGESRARAMERAGRLIDYLGLSSRRGHKPSELSGGECQRAAVARALVNNPRVLLADEPTGSLDSANRRELHRLFFDLRRDMGVTMVIVTHDENLAADCDRVVHIVDGRVAGDTANSNRTRQTTDK